jgi:transposase
MLGLASLQPTPPRHSPHASTGFGITGRGCCAAEKPVLRRALRRRDMITFFERLAPTRVAIEACGASHHWARLLRGFGHEVQLIAPQLVKIP